MNAWTIYGIVMTALAALVILLDNRQIRKLNSMADAADAEIRAWMRQYEKAKMQINLMQQTDARKESKLVLIRDMKIEHLKRKIDDMQERHRAELIAKDNVIRSLENGITEQRAQRGDRSK